MWISIALLSFLYYGYAIDPLNDGSWEPCDMIPPPPMPLNGVECLNTTVPLFWSNSSSSDVISIYTQRIKANPQTRKGSVWLFYGGPGSALTSAAFLYASIYHILGGSYDLYFPDYRGVGKSSNLGNDGCIIQVNGIWDISSTSCAINAKKTFGYKLKGFTATNIAKDLIYLVNRTKWESPLKQDEIVFTLGVSFGTYISNRFAQIAPEGLVNSMIFDGFAVPGYAKILNMNKQGEAVGKYILSKYCILNEVCKTLLQGDGVTLLKNIMYQLNHNSSFCHLPMANPNQISSTELSSLLKFLILNPSEVVVAVSVIHRLSRCNNEDVDALTYIINLFRQQVWAPATNPIIMGDDSQIHMMNIEFSELWKGSYIPSLQELRTQESFMEFANRIGGGLSPENYIGGYHLWDKYETDKYFDAKFASNITFPLLILNGDFDTATPFYNTFHPFSHYSSNQASDHSHVQYITLPYSTHTTIGQSPTVHGLPCGCQIIADFIIKYTSYFKIRQQNPNYGLKPLLELSCINDIVKPDWEGQAEHSRLLSMKYFNSSNLYGISITPSPPTPTPTPIIPSPPSSSSTTTNWYLILGVCFGCVILGSVITYLIFSCKTRRANENEELTSSLLEIT